MLIHKKQLGFIYTFVATFVEVATIQGARPVAALLVAHDAPLRQHVGSVLPDHRHAQVLERGPGLQSLVRRLPVQPATCGTSALRLRFWRRGGLDTSTWLVVGDPHAQGLLPAL